MTPEEVLAAINALADTLRADVAAHIEKLDAKYDELAGSIAKMKSDAEDENAKDLDLLDPRRVAAQRVAADSVDPAAFAALASSVADLKKRASRPQADLNAFADAQAKADSVMRALGGAAEPPMAGEDLVSYKIRMHRKMQLHSPRWKGVELQLIAADQVALDNVLGEIRADAMTAAMSPVGMPEFQHRMITKTMPGGHIVHEFIGNGTIFKQLSRPVRHVAYIGTRN